ncbi:MAG: phage major capsid protein [Acutalibacteraceae bacterium]|nr:phage major capsid protein [Acutalibacteraceae bacterium]
MSFDTLKIEKGMYAVPGKSFTQVLEEMDPSENYKGTDMENMDAFQRQLKRFDIKVAGRNSDMIQKFYSTSDSAALFPEYISRAIATGIEQVDLLPQIVATTTKIDGMDYRSVVSNPSEDAKTLSQVEEGAQIPETTISTRENLVSLTKRGRMLVASYEAIKYQRLDLFTVMLRQIGSYIAKQQFADAVNTIITGDGNENPATEIQTAASNSLTYSDMLNLWLQLDPYEMNTVIASPTMMMKIMNVSEFKDPQAGINFQGTGKVNNILGANFIKCDALADNKIIALDKRFALEMIVANDVAVEYDKLIDRQLERAAITCTAGFSKIFDDASSVLKIKA